jgi:hypothetical protein
LIARPRGTTLANGPGTSNQEVLMQRLQKTGAVLAIALAAAGCGAAPLDNGAPVDETNAELAALPVDPEGLTYEDEPDAWQEAPGTVGEGEENGVFGTESCRLHSGIANGNYTRLTPYQVAALAHRYGVPCGAGLVKAVAVSGAESSRYQYAYLINTNCSTDRGLWQINSGYWGSYSSYAQSTNAHGMSVISNKGRNWQPWVTYNNGAYKRYWSNACAAVKAYCGAAHAGC